MTVLLLALLALYQPELWMHYPSMDNVRCISTGPDRLYIAVPGGVYILSRNDYRPVRTLTASDGLDGSVRLCAYNPTRGDLLIATEVGLYQYLHQLDQLTPLHPPFAKVRSIGIAPDGAWFDTEQGLFRKERLLDRYETRPAPPGDAVWYGERDEKKPDDYVFLVPYYLTDPQLNNHRMTLVHADTRRRQLFVGTNGYGVMVYSSTIGLPAHHIRLGPGPDEVRRITELHGKLWFHGAEWTATRDRDENWSYLSTRLIDLPGSGSPLVSRKVLDLDRRERVGAVLSEPDVTWLGTGSALYAFGPQGKLTRVVSLGRPINGLARVGDSLIIGTDVGLYALIRDSLAELRDPYDRTGFGVYSMAQTGTGSFWLGTLGGILHYETGAWQHIIPPGFDLSRPVRGLAANGDFVFFDNGSGISVHRRPGPADSTSSGSSDTGSADAVIDRFSGLPSERITSLFADDSHLWIAMPGIVSRFSYRSAR